MLLNFSIRRQRAARGRRDIGAPECDACAVGVAFACLSAVAERERAHTCANICRIKFLIEITNDFRHIADCLSAPN